MSILDRLKGLVKNPEFEEEQQNPFKADDEEENYADDDKEGFLDKIRELSNKKLIAICVVLSIVIGIPVCILVENIIKMVADNIAIEEDSKVPSEEAYSSMFDDEDNPETSLETEVPEESEDLPTPPAIEDITESNGNAEEEVSFDALSFTTNFVQPKTIDEATGAVYDMILRLDDEENLTYSYEEVGQIVAYLNGQESTLSASEVADALINLKNASTAPVINSIIDGGEYSSDVIPFRLSACFTEETPGLSVLQTLDDANIALIYGEEKINDNYWTSALNDEIAIGLLNSPTDSGVDFNKSDISGQLKLAYDVGVIDFNASLALLYPNGFESSLLYRGGTYPLGNIVSAETFGIQMDTVISDLDGHAKVLTNTP